MSDQRQHPVEQRVRFAMRQLLAGDIPEGLKCDVKSLCALSGVPRATLYRAYPYLKAEFEQQRDHVRADGTQPDPRLAQIERLKAEVTRLRERLASTRAELDDAKIFRGQALSRIAAQHEELAELRIRCAGSGGRTTDAISRPPLKLAPPD
ncbi:hypothetical protein [Mycobacterium intracellulare]|uniref:hypothetical protein n=1 Tax=Mycobacterium intracellulare TaxID=1767 RepID=UPI0006D9A46D|nr:hypothetical protein [Mycobacterium intracellulare]KPN46509.1 hypothetical protein AN933_25925 [Mycobacterium intracellulare subsp. chimaera]